MKTTTYNPSKLELEFCQAIQDLIPTLSEKMPEYKIAVQQVRNNLDNPFLDLMVTDADGDEHEIVIKFVQRADR